MGDWVYIELRDAVDPTIVQILVPALVQRDGDIEVDGVTQLTFNQVLGRLLRLLSTVTT
jgi:hypothetical protein